MAVVIKANGERLLAEEIKVQPSGGYRWDVFYRALRGGRIRAEIAPEQVVEGLRIIRAMAEAHRSGCTVRVD